MMNDLSPVERLLASDPASDVTESELVRSRARSLSFRESDATQIFAGGSENNHYPLRVKRRRVAGGFLAAAAVAAVLTATFLETPPIDAPAATATPATASTPAASATSSATAAAEAGQVAPAGPLHDLFVSADEVLVLEALPNPTRNHQTALGVEPVNVRQVLKGSRALGTTSLDVASADDATTGSLLWWRSQKEAPFTYLGFFTAGADGETHLMEAANALLQIQNLRTSATVDPATDEPVDIGDDLRSRINVAPVGDVPVSTYPGGQPGGAATDVIWGTEGAGGEREGLIRGHISAAEACFTFESSTEKVYLRWPAGFTAAVRSLPVDAQGRVSLYGTAEADTSVVLNEWGFIYMTNLQPRPLVTGHLSAETASCGGDSLPVFDVQPERVGGSIFQHGRGVALPTP